MTVTAAMVEAITAADAGLRALGNAEGGHEDNLRLVHHQLTSVATLLRQARFPHAAVANRLLAEWSQLSQVAGWLAHDAGEYGRSQRYFTSGLHAAHTAGDRSGGVYLLVSMSGTVVHRGRLAAGINLGRAAGMRWSWPTPRTRRPAPPPPQCARWLPAGSRWPRRRPATRMVSMPLRTRPAPCSTPRARWRAARLT